MAWLIISHPAIETATAPKATHRNRPKWWKVKFFHKGVSFATFSSPKCTSDRSHVELTMLKEYDGDPLSTHELPSQCKHPLM